jgi:heat shock protein HslJ
MRCLGVLACAVVVLGCHESGDGGAAVSGSFEGVPWALESGASARFADGTVSGSTGCNRYTAPYTEAAGSLEIGAVVTTKMACPEPETAVEAEFLAALERVAAWRADGDELVLADSEGAELLRFHEPSLSGDWVATMFLQPDAVVSVLEGTEITATFGADGTLRGSGGCNNYTASYTAARGSIRISEVVTTDKACPSPPGVMEQERQYLAALPLAAGYTVEGGGLSLLTAQGTYVATYARP